jgi:thioredoxin-like negative regulator of GroEL
MVTRIAKDAWQRPGVIMGGGSLDSIRRRHRKGEAGQRWRIVRRSLFGYTVAGLVVISIGITWTLGVVGCTSVNSSGYVEATSGAFFPNIGQSPGEVSRLLRNAHYYKLMGRPELALKELELAHNQAPDNLQIVNNLAQNYEAMGQFEAARKLYREALTRHPHPALANNLCFTYYLEGRWQEAETCYRQTLAHDPGNEAARNNLGLLYCRLGRQDEARQLWQEAEGNAAAAYKTRQALAALAMSDGAAYAQTPEPVTPLRQASTPTPVVAVPTPPATASRLHTPAKPLAPQKVAMQLTTKPAPEKPVPDEVKPLDAARQQPAPTKLSPAPSPAQAPRVDSRPRPAPLTAAELEDTAIEVRNGNGTRHMARQTRTLLNQEGFTVAKIGNHIDFGAEQTVIYYRPEGKIVACALGRTFFPNAKLEPSQQLHKNISVKILLGADLLERPRLMARLVNEGQ